MEQENHGWLPEPIKETDYVAGEASGIEFEDILADTNWTEYLPDDERQKINGVETMSCVSFSAVNSVETQANYLLAHNKFSDEARTFFINNGYIVNGKFNFSDKFIAILSGTTREGNYLTKVADTIRKCGLIPESMLPFGNPSSFDEYHNPAQVTEEMKALGLESLKHFTLQYEWVKTMAPGRETIDETHSRIYVQMRQAPFQVAKNGHATEFYLAVFKDKFGEFDTYNPFRKNVPWITSIPTIMKLVFTAKSEYSEQEKADARRLALAFRKANKTEYLVRYHANGEAYEIMLDGSVKYLFGKGCPLFDSLSRNGYLPGISEEDFNKLKPVLIK